MKMILVADDSLTVRQQIRLALQMTGYAVVEASNGQEALALLARRKVALMICDVNMPCMNGLELLERLDRAQRIPTLMLTIETDTALVLRARRAGAIGWIIKPFNAGLLVDAIKRLLHE